MNDLYIDADAKCKVELAKIETDKNGKPYYIGKLQFPAGPLQFCFGISFMVFISEEGSEQLQIAPLDPVRAGKTRKFIVKQNDKLKISMHPMTDQDDKTYYIGEAVSIDSLDLREGVFFTFFNSRPGYEELQITKLVHNKQSKKES